MKLAIKTCTLNLPYLEMLDFCVEQKAGAVEIGTGNWSGAPHMDLDGMLSSKAERTRWLDELRRRDIALCALNCSGNPLGIPQGLGGDGKDLSPGPAAGSEKNRDDERSARRMPGGPDAGVDHNLLAARDPGHLGLSVE